MFGHIMRKKPESLEKQIMQTLNNTRISHKMQHYRQFYVLTAKCLDMHLQ